MNSAVWGWWQLAKRLEWYVWLLALKPITQEVGRNIAGTTNDVRDTWFSGFTSGLVTTTWVGFDDVSRKLGRAVSTLKLILASKR